MIMKYQNLLDRFITYVKVNTRSDENSTTTPSTQSQVDFATNVLIPEMKRVGLQNVYYLPNGYAIGTLPANDPSFTRKIGFISHMDTADFNAENVNPQIVENYDGVSLPLVTLVSHSIQPILLIWTTTRNKPWSQLMVLLFWVQTISQVSLKSWQLLNTWQLILKSNTEKSVLALVQMKKSVLGPINLMQRILT